MTACRILLIDDHAMFRTGIRMVLNTGIPDADIVEAGYLNEGLSYLPETPDVVLLDIKMPGLNGVDGLALLKRKWPQVPVVMLSSQDEPETVRMALARGAAGFISKAEKADKIIALLKHVLRGEQIELSQSTIDETESFPTHQHLTLRQCEVLELLSRGMSNKLIGQRLSLSENTVRGHVQGIFAFLQVSSRAEAAYAARQRGLIS